MSVREAIGVVCDAAARVVLGVDRTVDKTAGRLLVVIEIVREIGWPE